MAMSSESGTNLISFLLRLTSTPLRSGFDLGFRPIHSPIVRIMLRRERRFAMWTGDLTFRFATTDAVLCQQFDDQVGTVAANTFHLADVVFGNCRQLTEFCNVV